MPWCIDFPKWKARYQQKYLNMNQNVFDPKIDGLQFDHDCNHNGLGQLLIDKHYKSRMENIGRMKLSDKKFDLDIEPLSF